MRRDEAPRQKDLSFNWLDSRHVSDPAEVNKDESYSMAGWRGTGVGVGGRGDGGGGGGVVGAEASPVLSPRTLGPLAGGLGVR